MKTQSTSISEKIFNFIFTFLTSVGFGYAVANHFMLGKPNKELLLITLCLFVASAASWQRKKYSK
ncbi:hypothetical protein HNP37_001071 [Flavobacterium nitrogenifigens]|uniref:Uncharacterized protein n=2 Tax=Flavobacterium TaxID=237 RepID=A0A7W7N780_9FLAO|nr:MULTISPECIES: hypothetical protein [Flavobacterium]MBB4801032.1 hypothetical protein [Flavobacterium nitrogenifigens]MBB6385220.1 hypothetical protein [Flavobacterium notoginsengisoli]